MGIVFRRARAGDERGLTALVQELGYRASPGELERRLARLQDAPDHALFVAEEGCELQGWLHVQEFHSLASDPVGLVTGLVVAAPARGRGIGRELLARAEAWARERGLTAMRLRARAARREAQIFYVRQGYVLAKRQLQFRKEL